MNFKNFIQDKILQISLLVFGILTIEIILLAYPNGIFLKIYIPLSIIILYFISIMYEYTRKNKYYRNVYQVLDELEDKYLIAEIIKNSSFIEGKILKDILKQVDKSMIENVNKYKFLTQDYKEYVEMWIHEIKTPISTSKMIIENNKNEITKSIDEEIQKIEDYIEQALFYARSNTVDKDYFIKTNILKDIVNECIKKNKTALIGEKISVNTHDLDVSVKTDSKWILFILNQLIQNSVKYRKKEEKSQIEIYSKQNKENVILYIKDNGMGIKKGEITRVFEKGFTGTNGRILNKKSTGIGLYLSKKLCDKLGIAIELESAQNEGTEVKIIFPNSSYYI